MPTPTVSRLPHDGELKAMHNFATHASHCDICCDPYKVHLAGKTLCDQGHYRAREVAKYVYNKGGRAYSLVDLHDHQAIQVEIPVGCEAVRGLLKAMERGLRLRRAKAKAPPIVSYDKTYYVAPRPIERNPRPRIQIVDPPRRRAHAEKVVYIDDFGSQLGFNAPVKRTRDEDIILYAAPRHHGFDRRGSVYESVFHR